MAGQPRSSREQYPHQCREADKQQETVDRDQQTGRQAPRIRSGRADPKHLAPDRSQETDAREYDEDTAGSHSHPSGDSVFQQRPRTDARRKRRQTGSHPGRVCAFSGKYSPIGRQFGATIRAVSLHAGAALQPARALRQIGLRLISGFSLGTHASPNAWQEIGWHVEDARRSCRYIRRSRSAHQCTAVLTSGCSDALQLRLKRRLIEGFDHVFVGPRFDALANVRGI